MPWWVTHSTCNWVSLRSNDSFRTAWTPGRTSVPRPVTIRKPMPSPSPSILWWEPEMISASLGSATRHMSLNSAMRTRTTRIPPPARMPMPMGSSPFTGAVR